MATKTETTEQAEPTTKRFRRPKVVVLRDKIEETQKKIAYHQKHLDTLTADLASAEAALAEWESREKATAGNRIKQLEAELEALRSISE
jgi:septal ring factor EnvC (AmiA/AmiB activator)